MRNTFISLLRRPRLSIAHDTAQDQTKRILVKPLTAKMTTSQQNPSSSLTGKANHWSAPGGAAFDFRSKLWGRFL